MRPRFLTSTIAFAVLTACAAGPKVAGAGPIAAVDFDILSAGSKYTIPATRGWEFDVSAAITVTDLGWYDTSDDGTLDGFARPHEIGLWSVDGTLLATGTLNAGGSGILEDHFRYVAITPVTLTPGSSYIIAGTMGSTDPALRDGTEYLINLGSANFSVQPQITITHGRDLHGSSVPLTFPNAQLAQGFAVFGPNFKFEAQSVPEPSSIVLSGVGAGIVSLAIRRRKGRKGDSHSDGDGEMIEFPARHLR